MSACAQIAVLFVMRGVIINFSQLSPDSFHYTGRNHQLSPGSFHYAGCNHQILCVMPHKGTEKVLPVTCAHTVAVGFQQKRTAPPSCS